MTPNKLFVIENKDIKFEYYSYSDSNLFGVKLYFPQIYLNGDERIEEYSDEL